MGEPEDVSQADAIRRFVADVAKMKEAIADVDVPGWTIGQPSVADLTDDLVIVVARSRGDDQEPFMLPNGAEVVVAVLSGSIQISSGATSTLVGRKFFVLAAGEGRSIKSLEHDTRIYCTFFRAGVLANGLAVDRQ